MRSDEEKGAAFLQRFTEQCSRGDDCDRQTTIEALSARLNDATDAPQFVIEELSLAIGRMGSVSGT